MAYKMKDSGVEWLGLIPEAWNVVRIGSQYDERRTKVSDTEYPPLSVTMKGIVPQLATAAKSDAHDDRKLVCIGDFAINSRSDRRGSCGISSYEGSVSLINTILAPREEMNPRYYNWLFHSSMFADEYYKWGHGIVNDLWTTNWQDMKKISIPEPTLYEQEKIADFLDKKCREIDSNIEDIKNTIEDYKLYKQSVILEATTKGIIANRQMKESGVEWMGNIPKEWKTISLKFLCSMQSGKTLSSEQILEEGAYPVYGGNGLRGYYNEYNRSGEYLLVGRQGALCGNVHRVCGDFWATEHAVVTTCSDLVDRDYLYYLLIAMNLNQYASNTAAQPGLAVSEIQKVKTCLVPIEEQRAIAKYLDNKCGYIDELVDIKTQLLCELERYKMSMIYEYVTGKKEVE